jgi:hypothetical protein
VPASPNLPSSPHAQAELPPHTPQCSQLATASRCPSLHTLKHCHIWSLSATLDTVPDVTQMSTLRVSACMLEHAQCGCVLMDMHLHTLPNDLLLQCNLQKGTNHDVCDLHISALSLTWPPEHTQFPLSTPPTSQHTRIHTDTFTHAHIHRYISTETHTRTQAHTGAHWYTCTRVHTQMHTAHMHTGITCTHALTHLHAHKHTCAHTYTTL